MQLLQLVQLIRWSNV